MYRTRRNGAATAELAPDKGRRGALRTTASNSLDDVELGHTAVKQNGSILHRDRKCTTGARAVALDVFHRFLALVGLFAMSPLLLALIALIRLTSPGPAIYVQVRVGLHGKPFRMYKLRSMPHEIEQTSGAVWASLHDVRATRIGRYLRSLHLDELPQLVNVIRGDMSLVGPRPERPEFTHRLARDVPGYLRRLAVRPGITGLAQINLPPDSDVSSVRRKTILDTNYVDRQSIWLDLRIITATAFVPFDRIAVAARRCLRVHHANTWPSGPQHFDPLQDAESGRNTSGVA